MRKNARKAFDGMLHKQTTMLSIRTLERGDITEVLRINAAAAPAVFRLDGDELARLMEMSSRHRVACQADRMIVGYALVFSSEDPYDGEEFQAFRTLVAEPFLYIDQVAVEAQLRGAGTGRTLYQSLAEHARSVGVATLCCEVNLSPANPASLAFHLRMGFGTLGEMATQDGRRVALLRRSFQMTEQPPQALAETT
jgi:predicted GNAT superfamily acetyltransferase